MFGNLFDLDRETTMVAVYTLTVFVSASLLFVVQPMVGKMILPHLGGSSNVWTTCMLFFQSVLVAGYVYAHYLARHVDPKRQVYVHLGIMGVACLFALPLAVPEWLLGGSEYPGLWLLVSLLGGIGLPLFVVSTSAPLFQRWFSYTDHPDAEDPYYLYAASNMGSILALLGYPFVVEPTLGLTGQSWGWSAGFIALVVMTGGCSYLLWENRRPEAGTTADEAAAAVDITWSQRGRWVFWAFLPSSLMLGVTHYMTTDIASMPLLWVLPLALYLGSFILVFSKSEIRLPGSFRTIIPLSVMGLLAASVSDMWMSALLTFHLVVFFLIAMYFHGRMAADRPAKEGLTEFFIWMSVGGALGGLFNALVAPAVFNQPLEYVLVLAIAVAAIIPNPDRITDPLNPTWIVPCLIAPAGLFYLWMMGFWSLESLWYLGYALTAVGVGTILAWKYPVTENLIAASVIALGLKSFIALPGAITYERSFFASYAVFERESSEGVFRKLSHGTTAHGVQATDGDLEETPLGYHHPAGPVGQVLEAVPSDKVAVGGLGAGAMAAYGGPERQMVFFEIDPAIEKVARSHFTYLDYCSMHCSVEIGDARKLLEKRQDGEFDIIFMDAYNSDSVPTHLLTREAIQMFLSKVGDDGVVVFNVSNRYLDIEGVVGGLAEDLGLATRTQLHRPNLELTRKQVYTSAYTVVANDEEDLGDIAHDSDWRETQSAGIVWTDNYSNVASVFQWDH